MSDIIPPETPESSQPPSPQPDWRDERRQAREERRAARGSSGSWIGGAVLILLGIIFLLQNVSGFELENWWALFILLPAFGSFATAWRVYQESGRLSAPARGSLLGGMVLTLIAFAFLFGFTSSLFWPILLIVLGIGILLNVLLPG